MNTEERLRYLFETTNWSEEDRQWVLDYLECTNNAELRDLMEKKFSKDQELGERYPDAKRMLAILHHRLNLAKPEPRLFSMKNWKRLSIAASVLLLAGAAFFFFSQRSLSTDKKAPLASQLFKNDVAPGRDNAILTLANGKVIVLDSAANGTLAQEGAIKVLKNEGKIFYDGVTSSADEVIYHTMYTAKGNQYHLQLADGSKVWLNAASSIRFPTSFPTHERKVEITGEVYFEVAHDASRPFTVKIGAAAEGGEVQVLGTHFNINAYDDEPAVKTTLAEGKVKVSKEGSVVVLKPLEQSVLHKNNAGLKVQQVDLVKDLAWRAGMFEFQDDDLPAIMRQLSRWYDVQVKFEEPVSAKLFNGSIRRQASLSQVLQILKLAGISYTLEGKNLTVRSN